MKNHRFKRTKTVRYFAIFLVITLCLLSCIHVGGTAAADQKTKAQKDTIKFENYEYDALTIMLITTEPISEDSITADIFLKVEAVKKAPVPTSAPQASSPAETLSIPETASAQEQTSEPQKESVSEPLQTERIAETIDAPEIPEAESAEELSEAETENIETEEPDVPDLSEPEEEIFESEEPEPAEEEIPEEIPADDEYLPDNEIVELAGAAYDDTYLLEDIDLDTDELSSYCEYIEKYDYYKTIYTLDGLRGATFSLTLNVDGPASYSISSNAQDGLATFTIETVTEPSFFDLFRSRKTDTPLPDFDLADAIGSDAYNFGIIANTITLGSDLESNFATDLLNPNTQTAGVVVGRYTNIAAQMYVKELSGTNGELKLRHNSVSAVFTSEKFTKPAEEEYGLNPGTYYSSDRTKQIIDADSDTAIMQIENYVNVADMLDSISSEFDSYYSMPDSEGVIYVGYKESDNWTANTSQSDQNNRVIDTTASSDNPCIVTLDMSQISVQEGALNIQKRDGQTVIINIKNPEEKASQAWDGNYPLHRYKINGSSSTMEDGVLADSIIWNFSDYRGTISIKEICGTVVAPNATAIIGSTNRGRIFVDSFYNPGGEWHFICDNLELPEIPGEIDPEPDTTSEAVTEPDITASESDTIKESDTTQPTETSGMGGGKETESASETESITETESSTETESITETESTTETESITETESSTETESMNGDESTPAESETDPAESETDPAEETTTAPIEETASSPAEETATAAIGETDTSAEIKDPSDPAALEADEEETTEKQTEPGYYPGDDNHSNDPEDPVAPNVPSQRISTDVIRDSSPAAPGNNMMLLSSDDDLIALNAAPDPMLISLDDDIPLGAPKTGDESNPVISLFTLLASACVLIFLLFRRKPSSLDEE